MMVKTPKKTTSKTEKVEPEKKADTSQAQNTGGDPGQQLVISNQYIKDFSFENPSAPQNMMQRGGQPNLEVNIDIKTTPLNEERLFEVVLSIRATASHEDQNMYIVDLSYAAIASVAKGVDDNALGPILMIEGSRRIFPFARALLYEITQAGGFMPLNIPPIDFVQAYQQRLKAQQEDQQLLNVQQEDQQPLNVQQEDQQSLDVQQEEKLDYKLGD
jgi:preprotein translocase subunit SecB